MLGLNLVQNKTDALIPDKQMVQVGIMVRDIEKSARVWAEFLGEDNIPSISIASGSDLNPTRYMGKPSDAKARLAFFRLDNITIELIEVSGFKCCKNLAIFNSGVDVDLAQVSIYDGTIYTKYGKIKEGESDIYTFTIPDENGTAIIELSWLRDWAHWGTSDLDILIFNSDGYLINVAGATGASPEVAVIEGQGDYYIMVDGYQVYWDKKEKYCLEIIYIADWTSLWDSDLLTLVRHWTCVKLPKRMHGVAFIWLYDTLFGYWYIADFVKV